MVPVAVALLFPVDDSILGVVIFTVFTKTFHELSKLFNVPVSIIVPPLHAGSDQSVNVVTGKLTPTGAISVITTLLAALPQLFP
ncbi:MAG: hypothetical protein WCL02_02565 [bacterium]